MPVSSHFLDVSQPYIAGFRTYRSALCGVPFSRGFHGLTAGDNCPHSLGRCLEWPCPLSFWGGKSGADCRACGPQKNFGRAARHAGARPEPLPNCALQAALRRAGDFRAGRRFAVDLRRALPERFIAAFLAVFLAGLAAFFFAVFAMSSFSLFL